MSYSFVIEKRPGCVVIAARGDATYAVNRDLMERIMADPDFVPGLHRLYDLRKQRTPLPRTDARLLADYHAEVERQYGDCKVAILVRLDLEYGRARVYTSFGEDLRASYLVTKDPAEARAWVGLPPEYRLPADD